MAIEINVPRLGWSMEEGTFSAWLKQPGETVRKGDLLFTLEGDKSAQDVESFSEGILHCLPNGPRPGDIVRVGQLLGYLLAEGEPPPASAAASTTLTADSVAPVASVPPAPAVPEREPEPTTPSSPSRPRTSPRARRRARALGIDPSRLTGTGRHGRIRERDVLAAAEATAESRTPGGAFRPHSPMRRRIAQRLLESHQSTAPVTLTTTADATNLVNLRSQFRLAAAAPSGQPVPSYNDLILKLTALVLRQHPSFNACWTDDGLRLLDAIDIALAVDTDAGLVSPVLRRVDQLGVRALAVESAALIGRARAGRLAPADLQDASFTVTSLGSLGIDAFTPIINPPQVAILGVGRIERKPVYTDDDRLVPRELMTLSLTFDHRAVDGGPAARFLRAIAEAIAAPAERLIV